MSGIDVDQVTNFVGGISNSGTITANIFGVAIEVFQNANFAGGITNSGRLTAGTGIFFGTLGSSVLLFTPSTFSGGITNSGAISATKENGIDVANAALVLGGIVNTGAISAIAHAILVSSVTEFAGGITNSGHISGGADRPLPSQTSLPSPVASSTRLAASSAAGTTASM